MELEQQMNLLYSQYEYNKRKLEEFANELKIKDAQTALRSTGTGSDPYLVKLSQDLALAKQKYARLKAVFKDAYPEVISVKNEIQKLEKLINARKQETAGSINIPRSIYDGPSSEVVTNFALTQAEMVAIKAQIQSIQKSLNRLKTRKHLLPKVQLGIDELTKLESALAEAYKNIKAKQLEAKIKENQIIDNIIALSTPSSSKPLRLFIFTRFIGFMLFGTLLGLAIAYVKQALEDKWTDTEEMKFITGYNILGSIPWIKDINNKISKNILDAAYTNISSEIILKACLNNISVISFISTAKNPAKSTISEFIARKISQMDKSVLLIDLVSIDNTNFDLIEAVKLTNQEIKGFIASYKTKSEDEKQAEHKEFNKKIQNILKSAIKKEFNFNKIETNISAQHLNDFISSKGFKYILAILKQHYNFVFINAPHGFVLLPEIQKLKQLSEGIILISSLQTGKQNLIKFVQNISNGKAKVLGIIPREENAELESNIKKLSLHIRPDKDPQVAANV